MKKGKVDTYQVCVRDASHRAPLFTSETRDVSCCCCWYGGMVVWWYVPGRTTTG